MANKGRKGEKPRRKLKSIVQKNTLSLDFLIVGNGYLRNTMFEGEKFSNSCPSVNNKGF